MKVGECDFVLISYPLGSWMSLSVMCLTHRKGKVEKKGYFVEKSTTKECAYNLALYTRAVEEAIAMGMDSLQARPSRGTHS